MSTRMVDEYVLLILTLILNAKITTNPIIPLYVTSCQQISLTNIIKNII